MSRAERSEARCSGTVYVNDDAKTVKGRSVSAGHLLNAIGTILMLFVIVSCLGLIIPKLMGYDAYVVVSGSMEPAIPVGSIVYSHKTDPAQLNEGDVIVFTDPARGTTPITHRVVSNDRDRCIIITKGDANAREDADPVTYDNVMGKVGLHIPHLGFVASVFTSTLGKIAAALMLLESWLLSEIGRRQIKKDSQTARN